MKRCFLRLAVLAVLLAGAAQAQWLDTTLSLGVGRWPSALAYDSADNKVFCANTNSDNVTVIDGASNQIITTVAAGGGGLCYNPQNNKVYCANSNDDSLVVIDGASNQIITTVAIGVGPHVLCHNRQNNKVYCTNQGSSRGDSGSVCLLYTSPSPRDYAASRMPSSA